MAHVHSAFTSLIRLPRLLFKQPGQTSTLQKHTNPHLKEQGRRSNFSIVCRESPKNRSPKARRAAQLNNSAGENLRKGMLQHHLVPLLPAISGIFEFSIWFKDVGGDEAVHWLLRHWQLLFSTSVETEGSWGMERSFGISHREDFVSRAALSSSYFIFLPVTQFSSWG